VRRIKAVCQSMCVAATLIRVYDISTYVQEVDLQECAVDHVGIWPSNTELEVERLLCVLGLHDKRDTAINIESFDPAPAKTRFPIPTTYGTVLRHYIDISALAGPQILCTFSKSAPTPQAELLSRRSTPIRNAMPPWSTIAA
jgi:sulfite reductase alpha subunit-like flavoprotein